MKDIQLSSPLAGRLIALKAVNDPAFAAMGRGAGVADPQGQVYSPFDGEVTVLFPTGHAIGLRSDDGIELLIHVGINTVALNGEHFAAKVAQGDRVKRGQILLEFDPAAIAKAGYDVTTSVVVTNAAEFGRIAIDYEDQVIMSTGENEEAPAEESGGAAVEVDSSFDNLPDEQRVANLIAKYVGGMDNVRSAEHCATRLRLILDDKSKIQGKAVENIDGVKGQFFAAQQYQIILGTGFVDKVTDEFIKLKPSLSGGGNKQAAYEQMSLAQKISRTLGDVFVPIIPVLVATGLFMGLRGAAMSLGIELDENLMKMSQILTDTAFAFLPALVCWSTMNKFGGTPVIGIVLGLMLVSPILPNAYAVAAGAEQVIPLDLGFVTIPLVGYQGSVLPALVLGIFAAKLQQWLKTFIPDIIDLIVTPFLTLAVSMVLGILVVGPIMHGLESIVFGAVQQLLEFSFVGGLIIGGLQQVIVVFGVHHVFNALEAYLLTTTGHDPFNAIITGAIIAQGAAALAVALRTDSPKKRALYISSAVPAFLGITEPAIFGINLRFMKPFLYGCIGGACAGAVSGFLHLAGSGMGITVIPGALLYLDRLPEYLLVNAVGFFVAFGLTFALFKPEEE